MHKDIKQFWYFEQPPATVWKYLTSSELLAEWLMENDFKPIVGHQFQFRTKPKIKFGFDGIVYCEVLEIIPEKKLSYSWKGGPKKGIIKLDSLVTWTLKPKDKGTELILEHTGFKGWKNYISYLVMDKGWGYKIRKRIIHLINNN